MAIVNNLALIGGPVDPRLCTPNRQNAGSPIGSVVPLYIGEIVQDTTNVRLFQSTGPTNNDWMHVNSRIKS